MKDDYLISSHTEQG